jgi:hypothetical protein
LKSVRDEGKPVTGLDDVLSRQRTTITAESPSAPEGKYEKSKAAKSRRLFIALASPDKLRINTEASADFSGLRNTWCGVFRHFRS